MPVYDEEENGLAGLSAGTDSIAKGVFAFRRGTRRNEKSPRKTPSKRKKSKAGDKRQDVVEDEETEYFGASESGLARRKAYKVSWDRVTRIMGDLQCEAFDNVIGDVVGFVGSDFGENNSRTVPTCALVTGVNLPDHDDLFKLLSRRIRTDVTGHVAAVKSADCGTLKNLVKRIVLQLYKGAAAEEYDDESSGDDEEISPKKSKKSRKAATSFTPTLSSLKTWYMNQYEDAQQSAPLVVILEDFEGFPTQMLVDFIANFNQFRPQLPFVFVFGLATTVEAIHRSLPNCATSRLAIKSFTSTPSIHLLAKLVENLVTDVDLPFKLGGGVLKTLLETFSFHDLSVRRFLVAFKCCLLEHFAKSHSIFCYATSENPRFVATLGEKILGGLPSMGKCTDTTFTSDKISEELENLRRRTQTFNAFISSLHAIVVNLPRQPLGKNFHHVYNLAVLEPITQSHEYRDAFQFLQLSERTGLMEVLRTFLEALGKTAKKSEAVFEAMAQAKSYLESLETLDTNAVVSGPENVGKMPAGLEGLKAEMGKKKLDRFKLKEVLMEQAREKKAKLMNPFEVLRGKVVAFLHSTFAENLSSRPSDWPLNEVFYYDDVAIVKERLIGTPRSSIQTALKLPSHYIDAPELSKTGEQEIPESLPDICIAYKLHLECGKLVNLYDWLQCWLSIVDNSDDGEGHVVNGKVDGDVDDEICGRGDKVVDERLHARFSRAVSELQFLGFIKPSKRKTDHVERLTF